MENVYSMAHIIILKNTYQKYTGSFREHLLLPLNNNNIIKKYLVRNHERMLSKYIFLAKNLILESIRFCKLEKILYNILNKNIKKYGLKEKYHNI